MNNFIDDMHHHIVCKSMGTLLVLMGIAIRYWRARRRFNRRNALGIELFDSYSKKVFISCAERMAVFLATLMIVAGSGLILGAL